ncbi:hypothetical protein HYS30_00295 [Candidatus Peregrinibacteria bacterium]|uniref:Uncharacterized protein n=1 Tax=Candidatus Sungiibacteriota bacterium TaxID=2750080 RepID=A0A7T5RJG9_9BACT|nr:hypothetical protein [Candidatus Peregrinibacteria bacterium]QQG45296.1 MAG: hypothetical protein HYW89_04855 [Candidatus Sungbacteria bacterium]
MSNKINSWLSLIIVVLIIAGIVLSLGWTAQHSKQVTTEKKLVEVQDELAVANAMLATGPNGDLSVAALDKDAVFVAGLGPFSAQTLTREFRMEGTGAYLRVYRRSTNSSNWILILDREAARNGCKRGD